MLEGLALLGREPTLDERLVAMRVSDDVREVAAHARAALEELALHGEHLAGGVPGRAALVVAQGDELVVGRDLEERRLELLRAVGLGVDVFGDAWLYARPTRTMPARWPRGRRTLALGVPVGAPPGVPAK